jgi:hypothetical protein
MAPLPVSWKIHGLEIRRLVKYQTLQNNVKRKHDTVADVLTSETSSGGRATCSPLFPNIQKSLFNVSKNSEKNPGCSQ